MKSIHLKTFLAVAEQRSFSRAARRVHVSQSTASLHVRELEEAVGARLFERKSDGVQLTAAGQVLLSYAQRMLALEQEALAQVRAEVDSDSPPLRIASAPLPVRRLPPHLAALRRARPALAVSIRIAPSEAVLGMLREGGCDLALIDGPVAGGGIRTAPFAEDQIVLVGPPGAALLPDGAQPWLTSEDPDALRHCVLQGGGAALLPRSVVEEELRTGRLRELTWPGTPLQRTLHVAWRGAAPLGAAGELVGQLLGQP